MTDYLGEYDEYYLIGEDNLAILFVTGLQIIRNQKYCFNRTEFSKDIQAFLQMQICNPSVI